MFTKPLSNAAYSNKCSTKLTDCPNLCRPKRLLNRIKPSRMKLNLVAPSRITRAVSRSQRRVSITRNNVIGLPRIVRAHTATTQPANVRRVPHGLSALAVIPSVLPSNPLPGRLSHVHVTVTRLLMFRAARAVTGHTATIQTRLPKVTHIKSLPSKLKNLPNFVFPTDFF